MKFVKYFIFECCKFFMLLGLELGRKGLFRGKGKCNILFFFVSKVFFKSIFVFEISIFIRYWLMILFGCRGFF